MAILDFFGFLKEKKKEEKHTAPPGLPLIKPLCAIGRLDLINCLLSQSVFFLKTPIANLTVNFENFS